jgi:hypothetical protein
MTIRNATDKVAAPLALEFEIELAVAECTGMDRDEMLAARARFGQDTFPDGSQVITLDGVPLIRFSAMNIKWESNGYGHTFNASRVYEILQTEEIEK